MYEQVNSTAAELHKNSMWYFSLVWWENFFTFYAESADNGLIGGFFGCFVRFCANVLFVIWLKLNEWAIAVKDCCVVCVWVSGVYSVSDTQFDNSLNIFGKFTENIKWM